MAARNADSVSSFIVFVNLMLPGTVTDTIFNFKVQKSSSFPLIPVDIFSYYGWKLTESVRIVIHKGDEWLEGDGWLIREMGG